MALEQHSGYRSYGNNETKNSTGTVIIRMGKDGNLYIHGRVLRLSMALEEHAGFWTYDDIEIRDALDRVIIKLGKDGNIYLKGRILKIT